jgi:hypothetical protein
MTEKGAVLWEETSSGSKSDIDLLVVTNDNFIPDFNQHSFI